MDDRELLELAAKAEGTVIWKTAFGNGGWSQPDGWSLWNPLENDGDALRLAVTLQLEVFVYPGYARATNTTLFSAVENISVPSKGVRNDPYAATRRAIVRAAAAIGESM